MGRLTNRGQITNRLAALFPSLKVARNDSTSFSKMAFEPVGDPGYVACLALSGRNGAGNIAR